MPRLLTLVLIVVGLAATAVDAKTLRWSNRGDPQTTDPHSQNEGLTNNVNSLIYEFLVGRDKKLNLVPELAVSWKQSDPVTWRFRLGPGVKFHDGTPFTADDVVFTFKRARAETSQLRVYANAAGIREGRFEGNVDEVVFQPIGADATRVAALVSGEIDLINDPPPQDVPRLKQTPGIKVLEGVENRVVFIGMDQQRDELLYSDVKGRNPFKDKRVRQALYQAIDIEAIRSTTMRGLAQPTGAMIPAPLPWIVQSEKRLPFDRAKAKTLLADAGYPNGFEVTLDCPNNRYVNDENICIALAAMWSQIGVNTRVNAMPRANYFPKLEKLDTSLYMLGWGGAATDPIFILQPVLHSANGKGDGDYNYGRYTDAKLDALVDRVETELDVEKRRRLINDALMIEHDELLHLPLHRQVIPWASRSNVTVVHRADNFVIPYWVTIQ
jgi:peptide/nickel transport system substrate-binding protein